jgi:hypothetical protein
VRLRPNAALNRSYRISFLALLLAFCFVDAALPQKQAEPEEHREVLPKSVAPQPIAFSHKIHAGKMDLPCEYCHTGVTTGDEAEIPSAAFCMTCHQVIKKDSPEIAKLRSAAEKRERIAWVPVYRVPDFVFFGHAPHVNAGLHCSECHGPVETRDVLQKEVSTSMNTCRDCHRTHNAPTGCSTCHQLGY